MDPNFLKRIERAINFLSYSSSTGLVSYYDKTKENRKIGLFEKPLEYSYQQEFRVFVDSRSIFPLQFKIGSILDIAEIFNSNDILKLKITKTI